MPRVPPEKRVRGCGMRFAVGGGAHPAHPHRMYLEVTHVWSLSMITMSRSCLFIASLFALAQPVEAQASEDDAPSGRISFALIGGLASAVGGDTPGHDEYGHAPALGVRAGHTSVGGLYLGGHALYFGTNQGTRDFIIGGETPDSLSVDTVLALGPEVGYELPLGALSLRPSLGSGAVVAKYGGSNR